MKRFLVIPLSLGLLWTAACGPDDAPAPPTTSDITSDVTPDVVAPDGVNPDTVGPDGGGPDTTTVELSLAFHFAIEGGTKGEGQDSATLYPEDEPLNYAGIPSLQVDVVAQASGLSTGRPVELIVNGNKMSEIPAVAAEDGTATINFTAVTMPPSGNEGYTVTVQSTTTSGEAVSASKTVLVHTDECPVFVSPTTEEGCLITDADSATAGLQLAVQVMHTGGQCNRGRLTYMVDDAEAVTLEDVLFDEDGFANFVIPVTADDGPFEGNLTLTAEAIHPSSSTLNGTLAGLVYQIDTSVPVVTLTQPDPSVFDTINLTMDKSSEAIGIQYDVIGQVTGLSEADFNSLSLSIDGVPAGSTTPQSGVFSFQDVTFTQNGDVTISVSGADSCANVGVASVDMKVFSGLSELSIDSPTTGTTLYSKDNGADGTSTVYSTNFGITASDLLAGNTLLVECRALNGGNTYFTVGSLAMTAENIAGDNVYTLPVSLDTATVSTSILCRARVDAENPNQSTDIALTVGLPAPSITLSAPGSGVKLNTLGITLVGEASNLEGQPLKVTVSTAVEGGMADCSFNDGSVAGGVFSFVADLGASCPEMSGGSYTITVGATDTFGNTTADNGGDASVLALFDVDAPTLALTTPAPDSVLDPLANPGTDADSNPEKPGYQTSFSATMTGETDTVGAEICLSVGGDNQGCQGVAADFTVTWPEVTLQPGVSAVTVSGQDAYGNEAAAVITTVDLDYAAPIVKITTPAADLVTTADTLEFVVEVTDSDTGAPVGDASVVLLRQGTDVAVQPTIDAQAGTYTFTGVEIIPASQMLPFQATADSQGLQGASAERMVTKKTSFPTIAIDNVVNGQFFNLASAECAGSQADCALAVTAILTDAEPGSMAEVSVSCAGDAEPTVYQDTIEDLTAAFDGVVLKHGGACGLTACVTDLAAQKVCGGEISVSVDRVAPTVVFDSPSDTKLLAYDDQDSDPGMQSPLQLVVSGVETNKIVSVKLQWTDEILGAQEKTLNHTMTQTVGDGEDKTISFEEEGYLGKVTYPEGSVLLTAVVSDAALNVTSIQLAVIVQSNPPNVIIQTPLYYGDQACATSADCSGAGVCNESLCWTPFGTLDAAIMNTAVTGFITTSDNVRLCSDHASVTGAGNAVPCATDGYAQASLFSMAAGGTLQVSLSGLPDGYQRVVMEMQDQQGAAWTKSVEAQNDYNQSRRIYIDTVAPAVTSLSSSSDVIPPTGGTLNAAEVSAGGLVVNVGGYYLIDVEADSSGTYDVYVQGVVRASGEIVANTPTQAEVLLDEGGNEVYVKISDTAGNPSVLPPSNLVIYYQPTVDTLVPEVYFENPDSDVVLAADNLNISLFCSENGSQVTLYDLQSATPDVPIDTLSVTSQHAVFPHATYEVLSDGQHELQAQVLDPAGNATSVQTSIIQVDATAPTVAISSPANGIEISDDADAAAPGFQVSVDFTTAGDASDYEISVASGCANDYTGCGAPVSVNSGSVTNPGGAEPTKNVTIPIAEALSYKQVTVEVSDVLGNVTTDTVNVSFNIADCAVAITNLPNGDWFNASSCAGGAGCASASVDLAVTFFGCGAVDDLQLTGADVTNELEDLPNGSAVYTVTLNDGVSADLEVKAFVAGGETGSSGVQSRGVDLTPPDVSFVSTTVGAFVTPVEGESAMFNAADDVANNAGFQGYLALSITDTNATDGSVTSITTDSGAGATAISFVDATTLPSSYAGPSGSTESFYVYYPEGASTVVATAVDAAGNSDTATFDVTVDTIAPDAVLLTNVAGGVLSGADVNPRLPNVTLRFNAVGDDGVSGTAAGYGIRYSRDPIDESSWATACDVSALVHTPAPPNPAAAGQVEALNVSGPDPRDPGLLTEGQYCTFATLTADATGDTDRYYFAVRAYDDAGNWSAWNAGSAAHTDDIVFGMDRITFTPAFDAAAGISNPERLARQPLVVGDVDGDGTQDFLSSYKDQGFCLFLGGNLGAEYTVDGLLGASHECVTDETVITGESAENSDDHGTWAAALGDVNGDGLQDFGVIAERNSAGMVAIYLGVQDSGPDLSSPNVRIVNVESPGTFYGLSGAGNFNGDVHSVNGNPLHDIVVAQQDLSSATVFGGNETWTSATSLTIDMTNATHMDAHALLNIAAVSGTINDLGLGSDFGERCSPAGDVLPTPNGGADGMDDILIGSDKGSDPAIWLIPGREITTYNQTVNITGNTTNPTGEDALVVQLRQNQVTGLQLLGQYGKAIHGGDDLTGDGVPDVIVSHSGNQIGDMNEAEPSVTGRAIHIFDGASLAAAGGTIVRPGAENAGVGDAYTGPNGSVLFSNPQNYEGCIRPIGDWDGWTYDGKATTDLAFVAASKELELRVNHATSGGPEALGLFPVKTATLNHPDQSGVIQRAVDGGADVTGDGLMDVLVGTGASELYILR